MAFCSNCGTKLGDNDGFCYVCGAPQRTAQGVAGQAPGYKTNAQGVNADVFKRYINEILFIAKGMILAPATTIAEVAKKNFKVSSFILGGLIMLIQGLLAMWAVAQSLGKLVSTINGAFSFSFFGMGRISVPYGYVFLYYLLLFILSVGLLYLALHVFGCYVFKGKGNWMSTWNIVAAGAVPFTVSMLAGIILGYVYSTLGQVVVIIGILISLVSQFSGVKHGMELPDNSAVFAVAVSNAVSAFFTLIFFGVITGSLFRGLF